MKLLFFGLFILFGQYSAHKKQQVAIIGGGGYIGSRIYNDLHHIYDITVFDRDVSVYKIHSNPIMETANNIEINTIRSFDTIIYLGGYTGRKICDKYPQNIYKENVVDIMQFVKKMLANQTFIFASTSAVMEGYGATEASETSAIRVDKLDNYAKSMYTREKNMWGSNTLPKMVTLRFGTVIGYSPAQRVDLIYMALIKSAYLYGYMNITDGNSWRAILGTNDLIRAICAIIENPIGGIYHLKSFNIKIASVANDISKTIRVPIHINDNKMAPTTSGFSLSSEKFEKTYQFEFRETSKSLIKELVEFLPETITAKGIHSSNETKMQLPPTPQTPSGSDVSAYGSIPCPVCGHIHPHEVLDLKEQPLANDFRPYISKNTKKYPLRIMTCPKCYHTFLSNIIDRKELFTKYLYKSGTSKTLLAYFTQLATSIDKNLDNPHKHQKTVLEIACNDGSQLDVFKKMGWKTYCVDPAENIVKIAQKKGHKVFVGFWGTDRFSELPHPENLDVILAQNVLAHVADPVLFLKACATAMGEHTILYVQTSQCQMLQENQFDTAYHEHISFFSGHSFREAARLSGLEIVNFRVTAIHGKSCLVSMRRRRTTTTATSPSLHHRLLQEINDGITTKSFYINYREQAYKRRELIIKHLLDFSKRGYVVGAYGAAAKGMVLLHFLLDSNENIPISFVVDDALLKQNTYCPGTNIPVKPTSYISPNTFGSITKPLVLIVFAWNFWEEIAKNIRAVLNTTTTIAIILPFPEVRLDMVAS